MLLATPVPHQLFSASMHLCLRQEGRKMECECARLVVHARHCFKRSSYWNGKEWRRAGGEEQATRGSGGEKKSEREQRGHWRAKNPFVTSIDCWDTEGGGGEIFPKVWERPSADSSPAALPSLMMFVYIRPWCTCEIPHAAPVMGHISCCSCEANDGIIWTLRGWWTSNKKQKRGKGRKMCLLVANMPLITRTRHHSLGKYK